MLSGKSLFVDSLRRKADVFQLLGLSEIKEAPKGFYPRGRANLITP